MKTLEHILIQRKGLFPSVETAPGDGSNIARQLDITLMGSGYKLSHRLFDYLSKTAENHASKYACVIIGAIEEQLGDHVEHNSYFKAFPHGVPETHEFWIKMIVQKILTGDSEYGRYQHSYEEMLEAHREFKLEASEFSIIDLGQSPKDEFEALFVDLASSPIPLNEESRELLARLYREGYSTECVVPVRENRAILNALKIEAGLPVSFDTPVDALRAACQLSGGDVTLAEKTRFASFKRSTRRALLEALDAVDTGKAPDLLSYVEPFKRLGERLHPGEFKNKYRNAGYFFDVARGEERVDSFMGKVFQAWDSMQFEKAIALLRTKPGLLLRNVDKIARECGASDFDLLLAALEETAGAVSAKVLISLYEHLLNRIKTEERRLFINRKGTAYVTDDERELIPPERISAIQEILLREISRRIEKKERLCVDPSIKQVALPLSEKTKSDGYRVLPRGSVMDLKDRDTLRFFIYWKQSKLRTDYDLSAAFFDGDFKIISQVSWTNLREGEIYHSGDLVAAPEGATEFIDIRLDTLSPDIRYIIPSVQLFSGESFSEVEEAFFGFMMRDASDFGAPFEALSVRTKFALRGDKRICLPLIFGKESDGWKSKWLDIYAAGRPFGNRVEGHVNTTMALAEQVYRREYFTIGHLLDLYAGAEQSPMRPDELSTEGEPVTFVGMDRPETLPSGSEFVLLEDFRTLIPE